MAAFGQAAGTHQVVQLAEQLGRTGAGKSMATSAVSPLANVLATDFDLTAMTEHLRACIDVELEWLDSMFLAVWDSAILGTLVGQPDDRTLHVPGPVLFFDNLIHDSRTDFIGGYEPFVYFRNRGIHEQARQRAGATGSW